MQDNFGQMTVAAADSVEARSQFIWKCYAHVVGAILAFAAIEVYLFSSGIAQAIAGGSKLWKAPLIQSTCGGRPC